jgi:tetratricopeptide (TPR) repeat protein
MKKLFSLLVFMGFALAAHSQTSLESLIQQGIKYHDEGKYDEAIRMYELALEQDPNYELAYYELAFSYYAKNDLKKAIEYADLLIKKGKNERYIIQAYLTKANALDNLGEPEKAIKVYKKAIKANKNEYLLYYNLGLTYLNLGELKEAEKNMVMAIEKNPNHASSHALLAELHSRQGNRIQSILAAGYFLSLEPNSKRSKLMVDGLELELYGNVTKGEGNNIQINLNTDATSSKNPFKMQELFLSMKVASNTSEFKDSTSDAYFAECFKDAITLLALKEDKGNELDIWWDVYLPFYDELEREGFLPSFARYISQSGNPDSIIWLDNHPIELRKLEKFLKERQE